MKTHAEHFWQQPHIEDPSHETPTKLYGPIALSSTTDSPSEPLETSASNPLISKLNEVGSWIIKVSNPPLIGGISSIFFGIIPFLHHQFFDSSGVMSPIANSIDSIGNLYTALQMLVRKFIHSLGLPFSI